MAFSLHISKLNFFPYLPKGIFSFPSKPKVAIAKFVWKMQKKVWHYVKWVGRHTSFPPRRSVKKAENSSKCWE